MTKPAAPNRSASDLEENHLIPDARLHERTDVNVTKSWNDGLNVERQGRLQDVLEKTEVALDQKKAEDEIVVPDDPRLRTLNQERVDEIRQRVNLTMIRTAVRHKLFGPGRFENKQHRNLGTYYLYFPTNDVASYQLRQGNPPSRSDMPKHMHDLDLVIDLNPVPIEAWDFVVFYEKARRQKLSELTMRHKLSVSQDILDKFTLARR